MLYPIELLRHKSTTRNAVRGTACMLTTYPAFVMLSLLLSVGKWYCREGRQGLSGGPRSPFIRPGLLTLVNRPFATILVQDRDGTAFVHFRYPPDGMAHRHNPTVTNCEPVVFFQPVRIF